ncbi:MAG: SRPBCC family protein [Planctomycetota bacterium]
MKPYTVSIDIDLPRDKVIELFDDPDNLFKWQNGLQSFDHVSGEPGQPGAVSRMVYLNGKHRIELMETITVRNLPDEFSGIYAWGGGSNTLVNKFIELAPDRTRWESTCTYTMKSLMLKFMGFFFPGMFKEQNMKFLRNFKAFAEDGKSVQGDAG